MVICCLYKFFLFLLNSNNINSSSSSSSSRSSGGGGGGGRDSSRGNRFTSSEANLNSLYGSINSLIATEFARFAIGAFRAVLNINYHACVLRIACGYLKSDYTQRPYIPAPI